MFETDGLPDDEIFRRRFDNIIPFLTFRPLVELCRGLIINRDDLPTSIVTLER